MNDQPEIWLLTTPLDLPGVSLAAPTVAWFAEQAGATLECYFECSRDGRLFARAGSTVLGGHHHHQFNWLCARAKVKMIRLGNTSLFDSSIRAFGLETIADAENAVELYQQLLARVPEIEPKQLVFAPEFLTIGEENIEIGPYFFSEVFFRKALGLIPADISRAAEIWNGAEAFALHLSQTETAMLKRFLGLLPN